MSPTLSSEADVVHTLLNKTVHDSTRWAMADALALAKKRPVLLTFLNAHGVNCAVRDPDVAHIFARADYLLRDGVGVEMGLKYLGLPPTDNLNGTDLIPKLLGQAQGRSIAIFGTKDEVLRAVEEKLQAAGHTDVVALEHGFHDYDHYADVFKQSRPDILLLCMGMPRQERLAERLLADVVHPSLIVCAGGWADFYSGTKKRAPEWMRNARAEWLHRLAQEPGRLGKRYTVDIAVFMATVARAKGKDTVAANGRNGA